MDQKIILVIIALLLIGGYFVFVRPEGPAPETQLEQQEGAPSTDEQERQAVRQITVTGTEFRFEPSEITAKAGERLRVIFINNGSIPHNFAIEELDVTTNTIEPGQQGGVEFTVPAEGEYTVFCSLPGHKEGGMVGTLTAE